LLKKLNRNSTKFNLSFCKSRRFVLGGIFGSGCVVGSCGGEEWAFRLVVNTIENLWDLYSSGKQTYSQLAAQFSCSTKTIQRLLDKALVIKSV
jgi:hypothetical protein